MLAIVRLPASWNLLLKFFDFAFVQEYRLNDVFHYVQKRDHLINLWLVASVHRSVASFKNRL